MMVQASLCQMGRMQPYFNAILFPLIDPVKSWLAGELSRSILPFRHAFPLGLIAEIETDVPKTELSVPEPCPDVTEHCNGAGTRSCSHHAPID